MSWLTPISASLQAARVDRLFAALLILSATILMVVVGLMLVFAFRYRKGSSVPRGNLPPIMAREWEIGWTTATLLLFVFLFWWAASVDMRSIAAPPGAMDVRILAKQWMWESQQSNGVREIDTLHVPIDTPVRLLMTSQDVIHSFFVPAFRLKQDVLPGRDAPTQAWFQATRLGTFGLLCAEYCGTDHSVMRGEIVVLRKDEFAGWLQSQPGAGELARRGAALFVSQGCSGCHAKGSVVHAPILDGIFGRTMELADHRRRKVDEAYLRDSILQPRRDVVAGYEPIMPTFEGVLSDGEVQSLVAYIRSLSPPPGSAP